MRKKISTLILTVLAICFSDGPAKAMADVTDGNTPVLSAIGRIGVAGMEYRSADGQCLEILTDTRNRQAGQTVTLSQRVDIKDGSAIWRIEVHNGSAGDICIGSLWVRLPFGEIDRSKAANENMCAHSSITGNSSFVYWNRFSNHTGILMTPSGDTSLEFEDGDHRLYIHAGSACPEDGGWRLPVTTREIKPGDSAEYAFVFDSFDSYDSMSSLLHERGILTARFAPGMVAPISSEVLCAIDSREAVKGIACEFPESTSFRKLKESGSGKEMYSFRFKRKGENMVTIEYGNGHKAYMNFFVTEAVADLIRLRSSFIAGNQQHRDTDKWYDGLFSIWDMQEARLLSPDDRQGLPDYVVGGSDDPSNSKPVFISEKNVLWPDAAEIEALEYYEDNFVYGKLQRTGDEEPFPYGIYGSDNWYLNRSGMAGDYGSGGLGRERMWRTFDYTTHIATYYNLYLIASGNKSLTRHGPEYWLDMAYHTAMAYFCVPYNIRMGDMWSFHGWCDWAYKQGNFHERYITDLICALDDEGRHEEAATLRGEWEKKVMYFMYEDPWPFGSEMYVDRTAFESSYYIADYGLTHDIEPRQNMWYDKNSLKWYSYDSYDRGKAASLMENQFTSNLAIRGIFGQDYWNSGTAWTRENVLCYMSQMGGTAILDYAVRYSDRPYRDVNYGFNSIMSSWALINTGYWSDSPRNYGAAGWAFSRLPEGHTYFSNIPAGWGPWRYCGEIDHGFTGGAHGMGTYVVDDPDFGLYAYGGTLKGSARGIRLFCDEACARRVFVTSPLKCGVELRQDAVDTDRPFKVSYDRRRISFTICNRYGAAHKCMMTLTFPEAGTYTVKADGRQISRIEVSHPGQSETLSFPLKKGRTRIKAER